MSDEKVPTDKVALTFNAGEYLLEIFAEPLDDRPIKAFLARNPEEVALRLVDYHQKCVMAMNAQRTPRPSIYHGAGSDRGEWEYPWMTIWELENKAQLTLTQQCLLEGIVNMRNQYVDALESPQRYATPTEPVV